jgi:hypothetical protein
MALEGIQQEGITKATKSHHMGPHYQTPTWGTKYTAWVTPPTNTRRDQGSTKIYQRASRAQHYSTFMEPIHGKLLLCEKER